MTTWILLALFAALSVFVYKMVKAQAGPKKTSEPHPNDVGTRWE